VDRKKVIKQLIAVDHKAEAWIDMLWNLDSEIEKIETTFVMDKARKIIGKIEKKILALSHEIETAIGYETAHEDYHK